MGGCRARRGGAGLPNGAPRPSRRAQRALPEAGSVPWQRRTARPARSHRLRSARNATCRPDDAGRCGAVWGCRDGRSRVVEALRQRRARAAQAARMHCAAAPPMAMWHEPAGGRRAAGATPSVRGARVSSRWGRCVTHWRSDGTTPPGTERLRRESVLLACSEGGDKPGIELGVSGLHPQATTRKPSTCGHSPRARSGLLPSEDHASNLVGAVRSKKGLLGRRRPFRAVRHFQRKWATRAPSTLQRG